MIEDKPLTKKHSKKVRSEITIDLPFENEKIATSVCQATSPENKEVPTGVKAVSKQKGNVISFDCTSEESFWNLITTVEDFLEKVSVSINTIEGLKKKK